MDQDLQELLKGNVSFFKKFGTKVYSLETITKSYKHGFDAGNAHRETALSVEVERLTSKIKSLETDLNTSRHINLTDTVSNNKSITDLKKEKEELNVNLKDIMEEKRKVDLKVKQLTKELTESPKVSEIKALEQKIKDIGIYNQNQSKRDLKEATDGFLKTIKKYEKEIEQLKGKSGNDKKVTESSNVVTHEVGKASFTCEQIKDIRQMDIDGKSHTDISKIYGVNRTTITRIISLETYKQCK